jgi:hypothetical protein
MSMRMSDNDPSMRDDQTRRGGQSVRDDGAFSDDRMVRDDRIARETQPPTMWPWLLLTLAVMAVLWWAASIFINPTPNTYTTPGTTEQGRPYGAGPDTTVPYGAPGTTRVPVR